MHFRRNFLVKIARSLGRFLGLSCKSPRDIEPFWVRGVDSFKADQLVRAARIEGRTLSIDDAQFFFGWDIQEHEIHSWTG